MPLKRVFLALGSNLGDRQGNLEQAIVTLEAQGVHILQRSSIYETEPQELREQPWFLNMVLEGETRLFPVQLVATTQRIERGLGRDRSARAVPTGPRPLDIEIILFGKVLLDTPKLVIPHPRMLERRFVLEPLVEIAPSLRHPVTRQLLKDELGKVSGQKLRRFGAQLPG
jgi:2-amino-4-hydroxy-6-hydroxymethyldihydropteridine diphosphokinase